MDKKLIVDVDKIEFKSKKSEVKSSYDDLKRNIELLPNVLKIFSKIHIERLEIDGNEFIISLDDKELYLDNKFVNISADINFLSSQVVFDLYSLYLKDVDLLLDGKIKVDYFNDKLSHYGKYYFNGLEGDLKIDANKRDLSFYINSNEFESLKFLKKFFRLSDVAEAWMYDNVKGNIKLNEFYGKVDLIKGSLDEKSLKGSATINSAQIKFHNSLEPIITKKVDVLFEKDTLSFFLDSPVYRGIKMDGSGVVINNLTSEANGEVVVDIKALHMLDEKILGILNAYQIKLPLLQKSGKTDASVTLKIPYSLKKSMKTYGKFFVTDANININDFSFYSKKADVLLDGSIVKVKNAHFKHKNMIDANVNIDIDTKTLKSSGNANINSFLVKTSKDEILNIKNKKTVLNMDFNEFVLIELKDLQTKIIIDNLVNVDIANLKLLYPYSKLLKDLSITDGNLNLKIKDENNIDFIGLILGLDLPIQKGDKEVTSLNINGKIRENKTTVISDKKDIKIDIINDKILVYLKNHIINVNTKSEEKKKISFFTLKGENLQLKLDDDIYKINFVSADISDKQISFDGQIYDFEIPLKKDQKILETLDIKGVVRDDITKISTKDEKIKFELSKDNKIDIIIDGYDLYIDTNEKINTETLLNLDIQAKNSNIFLNDKYKFLADTFEVRLREESSYFHLNHKNADITYKKSKNENIDIFANDISDEFINTIFNKQIVNDGKLMFLANGTQNNLKGKLLITDVNIEDLAILNNLLLFIHSSPALINPFLAVPSVVGMASNKGFNLAGYKVVDGVIEFVYNKEKENLDITRLVTVGNGIDFEGSGKINLSDMTIQSAIKLIFFKDYSKLVGAIPVVNYVLLGSNKRVETKVNIFGPLENPKLSTNLTKDAFSVPLNIGKRILKSPTKLFEFLKGKESENKPTK